MSNFYDCNTVIIKKKLYQMHGGPAPPPLTCVPSSANTDDKGGR